MATKSKANLKSNPAIPGTLNREEPNYLRNVQQEAQQQLQRRNINQQALQRIGQLIQRAQQYQVGHEQALQQLAETVIRNNYGAILDYVELNLKLVPFGSVADETPRYETVLPEPPNEQDQQDMAEQAQQQQDQRVQQQPQDQNQQPTQELVSDEDIILEVHKRKIINNVVQGEGKNTHRLIHLPEVREALDNINPNLFNIYDEILKIAEYLDWVIPMEEKLYMMQNMPEGFGGFNSIDWKQPEGQFDNDKPDFLNQEGGEQGDMGDVEALRQGKDPVINAIGVDFPMLIHETVKAIYELIASNAIPPDAYVAETVMMNTDTLQDEIEDLRYGPFIAADLRNFINENALSNQIVNLREHVFGKIIQLPANEFLALMKAILMNTPQARTYIDEQCNDVAAEVRQNEYDRRFGEDGEYDGDDTTLPPPTTNVTPNREANVEEADEVDYSDLSKAELDVLMDEALDKGDFDTIEKIRPFLK